MLQDLIHGQNKESMEPLSDGTTSMAPRTAFSSPVGFVNSTETLPVAQDDTLSVPLTGYTSSIATVNCAHDDAETIRPSVVSALRPDICYITFKFLFLVR